MPFTNFYLIGFVKEKRRKTKKLFMNCLGLQFISEHYQWVTMWHLQSEGSCGIFSMMKMLKNAKNKTL